MSRLPETCRYCGQAYHGPVCADAWYIVITNPQSEREAATELRRAGLRVYLPKRTYEVQTARRGKVTRRRPLWTGYLLVRFPASLIDRGAPMFAVARDCRGVRDFLKWTSGIGEEEPVPIPSRVTMAYMRRQRAHDYDGARVARMEREAAKQRFARGTMVRVLDGAFAGFMAKMDAIRGDDALILVEIFGRETTATVNDFLEHVEPVAKTREAA